MPMTAKKRKPRSAPSARRQRRARRARRRSAARRPRRREEKGREAQSKTGVAQGRGREKGCPGRNADVRAAYGEGKGRGLPWGASAHGKPRPSPKRRRPQSRLQNSKTGRAHAAFSLPNPIELYYWPTPNGWKISIMLEECGLPYVMKPVNIGKGEQFAPAFLKISPNNRMPAIVDPDGPGGKPISVFESGAILQYLGRKTGKFYPADERKRVAVDEWLFWQMGGLGPDGRAGQPFPQLRQGRQRIRHASATPTRCTACSA